jgi:ABC-2 type transport system permease protein
MSGLRQGWLVALREMRERGRSRAFLASVAVMIIAVVGAIALPALLDTDDGPRDIGLTGAVPAALPGAISAQGHAVGTDTRIHRYDDRAEGRRAVRDGDIDVLVVDARTLEWSSRPDDKLEALVGGAIQVVSVRERARAAGMSPAELAALVAPVRLRTVELGHVPGRSRDDETAAFIMTVLLFMTIATYGAIVMSGVVEEKSSRVVEVLLARMPARHLLVGKIVGIGLLGLAQVVVTAVAALVATSTIASFDIPAVRPTVLVWAIGWFVLGYALYATVFGALGSLASRPEDAQSASGPVSVILVLGYFVSFAAIGSPHALWARLVSFLPPTAPIAMPTRIAMGQAAWWEPVVAGILTLASIAALVVLGGRIYQGAILRTGATLHVRDAWRDTASPAPDPSLSATGPEDSRRDVRSEGRHDHAHR